MSKHTPGPWHNEQGFIVANNKVVGQAMMPSKDSSVTNLYSAKKAEEMEANAARIVECVNACEGIENPADFVEIVKQALQEAYDYIDLDITPEGKLPEDATRAIRLIMTARRAMGVK